MGHSSLSLRKNDMMLLHSVKVSNHQIQVNSESYSHRVLVPSSPVSEVPTYCPCLTFVCAVLYMHRLPQLSAENTVSNILILQTSSNCLANLKAKGHCFARLCLILASICFFSFPVPKVLHVHCKNSNSLELLDPIIHGFGHGDTAIYL